MRPKVTIRMGSSKGLVFDVRSAAGDVIAESLAYDSICRLEAALGTLHGADAAQINTETTGTTTTITVGPSRRRVRLVGRLPRNTVVSVVEAIRQAVIEDERPAHRRRQDLSGMSCNLDY